MQRRKRGRLVCVCAPSRKTAKTQSVDKQLGGTSSPRNRLLPRIVRCFLRCWPSAAWQAECTKRRPSWKPHINTRRLIQTKWRLSLTQHALWIWARMIYLLPVPYSTMKRLDLVCIRFYANEITSQHKSKCKYYFCNILTNLCDIRYTASKAATNNHSHWLFCQVS